MKILKRDQRSAYDGIVYEYLKNQGGGFVLTTQDPVFIRTMRGTMRVLGLDYENVHTSLGLGDLGKKINTKLSRYKQLVLFIEAKSHGRSNVLDFKPLKEHYANRIRIIALTTETSRANIIFMTEYGVDSVIVKPVSVNSLIQKIALAIKPNTGFQRKVEKVRELIEQKNFAAAQEGIDALLDEKPDSSIALILKGDIARLQKDTELAASCYQQASEYSKLYLKPLERLVALYHETGDQENLLRYLLKMDQLSPMNYTRKIDIGQTYTDLGEKEKSEKFFSQAIKIVKEEANDMLASTLMDIGRKVREKDQDAAVRYMNDALDLKQSQPAIDDLWMYNELGLTFRQRGEWQNAVQTYEKALRIAPNDGGVHYNLAMAYAQGRDYRKAAEHAKQAEQHSSMLAETPAAAFNMASIYVKTAQKERAAKLLKSCLQGDPAHKGAKELLKKLSADF